MDDGIQLAQYKLMMEAYLSWERTFWTKFQILVGIQLGLFVISARAPLVSQTLLIGVSFILVILSVFTWRILRWEVEDQEVLIQVVCSLERDSRGRLYLVKRLEEVKAWRTLGKQELRFVKKFPFVKKMKRPKGEVIASEQFGRKPKLARDLSLFLVVIWVVYFGIALYPLAEAIRVWLHSC